MEKQPKRILVTGSSIGLEQMAVRLTVEQGCLIVAHGRSQARAADALKAIIRTP